MACNSQWSVWHVGIFFVLFDVLCLGFGSLVQTDVKCLPDLQLGNIICIDMKDSKYIEIPMDTLQRDSRLMTDSEDNISDSGSNEIDNIHHLRSEVMLRSLLKRLVSPKKPKTSSGIHVRKRPFDSIGYGNFFGRLGFGKKRK